MLKRVPVMVLLPLLCLLCCGSPRPLAETAFAVLAAGELIRDAVGRANPLEGAPNPIEQSGTDLFVLPGTRLSGEPPLCAEPWEEDERPMPATVSVLWCHSPVESGWEALSITTSDEVVVWVSTVAGFRSEAGMAVFFDLWHSEFGTHCPMIVSTGNETFSWCPESGLWLVVRMLVGTDSLGDEQWRVEIGASLDLQEAQRVHSSVGTHP